MGAQILHLLHEIFRILPVFSQFLWNLMFIISDYYDKFSLVLLQITNYIFSPWKMKKECNILEIILVQGFCPLNIKISQFPNGFHLNL